ncbi:MAG: bacillithiol biosynthesis cysteine-adding enzyme BshC [Lentimonas sp.]|jgi:bacillithiol biosynthesis cysteine-adding enzyme BshC
MKRITVEREKTGLFSPIANTLVYNQEELKDFIQSPFSKATFKDQIERKKAGFTCKQRNTLHSVLKNNYGLALTSDEVKANIELLKNENCFTVTTGHQLSVLTGPLYFVLKIMHVVNLAKELKKEYPDNDFIPVFWMASEDHDFEEIQSLNLFNKKFTFESDQTGPVGKFTLDNWSEFMSPIKELFANHPDGEIQSVLNSYNGSNLTEATFNLVNELFKKDGLVIVDGDEKELKQAFSPIAIEEIENQTSFHAVNSTNEKLLAAGHPTQAHAREINVFYCKKGIRERIKLDGDTVLIPSMEAMSKTSATEYIANHPEEFSPNVILRPLYQESILPNLCYVGGGGEMTYWLQLKGVFEAYKVPYPLIQVRNSMMIIDPATQSKMETVSWGLENLFGDIDAQKKDYVFANSEELNFSSLEALTLALKNEVKTVIDTVNPGLNQFGEAEMTKLQKQIDSLQDKLIKAEKTKHDKALKQMDQIKDRLFPNGGLQERSQNFFNFCADGEVSSHLAEIYTAIDSFENDFIVLYL